MKSYSSKINELAGYLVIDEQILKQGPKELYRVTLDDQQIINPIAEERIESRTKKNILSLIT